MIIIIKVRTDKTQQNSKCRVCDNKDETINHPISKFSKLAQKSYKTRHYRVGKVVHWEQCKKFNFTIRTNGMGTPQHMSWIMTHTNSEGILTYKRIT